MPNTLILTFRDDKPCRLDKYLVRINLPDLFSRAIIEKLINEQFITVNQRSEKKSYQLNPGDIITVKLPEQTPGKIIPQEIPLDIIYEDKYLAAINKQPDLVVHPGYGNPNRTLLNALVFHYGEEFLQNNQQPRPGIVHRLDKGTSGVMLIARNDKIQSQLSAMFAAREVKKTYLAITTGVPEPLEGTLESNISRNKKNPRLMAISTNGKIAITHYKTIRCYQGFALLRLRLDTGRTHQIRVHLSHLKTPILGDEYYNSLKNTQLNIPDNLKKKVRDLLTNHLRRQALHSWRIEFRHPVNSKIINLQAPLPGDLVYSLDWLEHNFTIDNDSYKEKLL